MGGKAFSAPWGEKPALTNFPRMPPTLYVALREQVRNVLSSHFTTVTFPAEAPEKADHGDLDVLVHTSKGSEPGLEHIAEVLGAMQSRSSVLTGWTLAVPMHATCFTGIAVYAYGPEFGNALVQVDLRVCSELKELHWRAFKNGYGDLWQILGVLIRPIGLTVDESHMCVRIQEIEDGGGSKDDTKVRLSDEPDEILSFLGLNVEEYKKGFGTEVQVFEWCARCRFFSTTSLFMHTDAGADQGAQGDGGVQIDSTNINHNDRQRFNKRLMFVRFRAWVRSNLTNLSQQNTTYTRTSVFALAVAKFEKQAYADTVLQQHRRIVREKKLRSRVAALMRENVLAAPDELAGVMPQDEAEVKEKKITDAVSRIMRGMKLFVLLDVDGLPMAVKPVPDGVDGSASIEDADAKEETAALQIAPSQNWADCSLGDEEFMTWMSQHWREVDAREIDRRSVGQERKMRRKKVVDARENDAKAEDMQ